MGRGRVQLKRIENKVNRQVTFSKRRAGLSKKAREISVLCGADVGLIVFSTKGKLFEYATESCMERILERYERCSYSERHLTTKTSSDHLQSPASWSVEHAKLKARIEVLERNQRHYVGDDLDSLKLKELQSLEHQLDAALKNVRSRQNQLMREAVSDLQKKDKSLQDQNSLLARKIKEKEKEVVCSTQQWEHHHQLQDLNTTSPLDITQPSSSFNVSKMFQAPPGENSTEDVRSQTQNQAYTSLVNMPLWMGHMNN